MLHAVIMAGGSGTRFWPASRNHQPKQLLDLAGQRTMIQATCDRLQGLIEPRGVRIITNARLVGAIREQLPVLPPESIIGEPCKRDTAPCVGLAAFLVSHDDPDAIMVILPADHVISPVEEFQRIIRHAVDLVRDNPERLVTLGIPPTYAAESFGYIERGDRLHSAAEAPPTFRVTRFHEKPKSAVAQQYLAAGKYYWNSGIFIWKAATVLKALESFEPEMYARLAVIAKAIGRGEFAEVLQREFAAIQGKSIDYAVMERAQEIAVVEVPFQWDDVGSWQAIARLRGTDADGNTVLGRHLGIDTRQSIVRSTDDHLIVTIGIHDCVIVHTPDATLVVRKDLEESVRKAVAELEARNWTEYL